MVTEPRSWAPWAWRHRLDLPQESEGGRVYVAANTGRIQGEGLRLWMEAVRSWAGDRLPHPVGSELLQVQRSREEGPSPPRGEGREPEAQHCNTESDPNLARPAGLREPGFTP